MRILSRTLKLPATNFCCGYRDSRRLYNQRMIFSQLARFTDVSLLLLRIMVGIVFVTGGWKHFQDPEGRSKSIGMSKAFTIFLGAAEFAGGLGVMNSLVGRIFIPAFAASPL